MPLRAPRRAGPLEALLGLVIVAAVSGLLYIGYLAWLRGKLDNVLPEQYRKQPATAAGADAAPAAADEPAPLTEQDILEDPLERVEQARAPGLGALLPFVKQLRDARDTLRGTTFTSTDLGVLNPEAQQLLESTGALGEGLLVQYAAFEKKAARISNEETLPFVQLLRDEFLARFIELIDALGEAYALDKAAGSHAYVLSDDIPRALEAAGQIDPAPVREHWQRALAARAQLFLDLQNAEAYRQLAARCQALVELHNGFNAAMEAIPPYRTRAGVLDTNGEKALELYDSLQTKIEELAVEFEAYAATLDPNTESDKRKELVARFTELAQTDHFTCFMETYKIYAMDHDLVHDAYTRLIEVHYPWVQAHWPNREPDYRAASMQYEGEWKQRWDRD